MYRTRLAQCCSALVQLWQAEYWIQPHNKFLTLPPEHDAYTFTETRPYEESTNSPMVCTHHRLGSLPSIGRDIVGSFSFLCLQATRIYRYSPDSSAIGSHPTTYGHRPSL
ncbi:uncharacterized protein F5147DRAFT_332577 [Suillus discolor]|uniref:Uncharacterized protein n=1 Tax=Suillus discolor TaxID=1912936 RepID=A0A9P7F0T5_9AGAM|nr:uncharacterized protein F5147DRAFT_332577 [Suillus discolor]KAG2099853.1 hypothetical protein F5147DRAFT_332577 [Suillus discolor]